MKLTVDPEIVQAPAVEAASIEKITGFPEAPPVAAAAYGAPPTAGLLGAVDVKARAWLILPTAIDCWTCVAAA